MTKNWIKLYSVFFLIFVIADIPTKLIINGLLENQVDELIECCIAKGIFTKEVKVLDDAKGSLIMWTRMSLTVFKSNDTFIAAIEKVLKQIVKKSPVEFDKTTNLTLDVIFEDDYQNGKILLVIEA